MKPPGRGNRSRSSLDLFPTWCLRQYEFGRCFGLFMDYGKAKKKNKKTENQNRNGYGNGIVTIWELGYNWMIDDERRME